MSRELTNAFWDDLSRDMEDPEFRAEYEMARAQIASTDNLMNEARP